MPNALFTAILASICLSNVVAHAAVPRIHVHYAFQEPKKDPKSPLDLIFSADSEIGKERSAFIRLASERGYVLEEFPGSTSAAVADSLKNPEVIGLIWVGHSINDRRCTNCDASGQPPKDKRPSYEIVNGHLRSATSELLTRHVFTSRTQNLKWISLVSCNLGTIWPKYVLSNANQVAPEVFLPKHSLTDVSLIAGMSEAFADTRAWIESHEVKLTSEEAAPAPKTLKIRYRDLISSQYTYEVLVDGVFVGELRAPISTQGLRRKSATAELNVPTSLLKPGAMITVLPNDPDRINPFTSHAVDNVLIDEVSLDGSVLWNGAVNIGDDDSDDSKAEKDTGVVLYQKENLPDLQRLKPIRRLDIHVQ